MLRDLNFEHSSEAQNFKFDPEKSAKESDNVLDQVEGMKDEHTEPRQKGPENINYQESEGVNNLVLKFNTEFDSADLSNPEVRQEWEQSVEGIKNLNKDEYDKFRMKLDTKLGEIS